MKLLQIINRYNIHPKYFKGQNFLIDNNISKKIINAADIDFNTHVLEIGSGIGSLTQYIVQNVTKKITLIEIDKQFTSILDEYSQCADILYTDVLKTDFTKIFLDSRDNLIISNLPYYLSSKFLFQVFKMHRLPKLLLMMQKELADRVLSKCNNKSYGKLSVIAQTLYRINKICDVKPVSFYPQPSVISSVLKFEPLDMSLNSDIIDKLLLVLKYSFSSRRKFLIKNLQILDCNIKTIFQKCFLNPYLRAENLTVKDYLNLACEIRIDKKIL